MTAQLEDTLEVLQLWQPAPPSAPEGVSFGVASTAQVSRWRLDLSADLQSAQSRLFALETQARGAQSQLSRVPTRLDRLVQQTTSSSVAGVSFGASPITESGSDRALPQPEADLLRLVSQTRGEQVSYGLGQMPAVDLGQIGDQFRHALSRFFQLLTHLAWVETQLQGQLLGQTVVSWTGQTGTVWAAGLVPDQRALHQRNYALALASRLTLLRTMVIATQGAAKIGVLLGMSGGVGAVAALPVAWRYVSQILAEIQRYQEVTISS